MIEPATIMNLATSSHYLKQIVRKMGLGGALDQEKRRIKSRGQKRHELASQEKETDSSALSVVVFLASSNVLAANVVIPCLQTSSCRIFFLSSCTPGSVQGGFPSTKRRPACRHFGRLPPCPLPEMPWLLRTNVTHVSLYYSIPSANYSLKGIRTYNSVGYVGQVQIELVGDVPALVAGHYFSKEVHS